MSAETAFLPLLDYQIQAYCQNAEQRFRCKVLTVFHKKREKNKKKKVLTL